MTSTQFNEGPSYGLSAKVKNQLLSTYDPQKEAELRSWIEGLIGLSIGRDFQKGMTDGIILCTFMSKLQPGSVPKINRSMQNWYQLENQSQLQHEPRGPVQGQRPV
ncbi:Calponin-2 [Plecturocebus cupreus]